MIYDHAAGFFSGKDEQIVNLPFTEIVKWIDTRVMGDLPVYPIYRKRFGRLHYADRTHACWYSPAGQRAYVQANYNREILVSFGGWEDARERILKTARLFFDDRQAAAMMAGPIKSVHARGAIHRLTPRFYQLLVHLRPPFHVAAVGFQGTGYTGQELPRHETVSAAQ